MNEPLHSLAAQHQGESAEREVNGAPQLALTPEEPESKSPAKVSGTGTFGLRDSDRAVLWLLAAVGLLLAGIHLWRQTAAGVETIRVDRPPDRAAAYQIDVNSATWVEWMQLEGIGETLARRIVADREERSPFASVDDVGRVRGIGEKTLDAIRTHLRCAPTDDSAGTRAA